MLYEKARSVIFELEDILAYTTMAPQEKVEKIKHLNIARRLHEIISEYDNAANAQAREQYLKNLEQNPPHAHARLGYVNPTKEKEHD